MTELIWEGKYGPDGRKNAPVRIALPFQDVETVNESAQTRQMLLDLWSRNQPGEWRNQLIWGDKKYVLPSLLSEFAGKVNLIYIDPPFATGADFSFTAQIADDPFTEGTRARASSSSRACWSRRRTATPGGEVWTATSNGFMKQ